jgi:hypothetical protein
MRLEKGYAPHMIAQHLVNLLTTTNCLTHYIELPFAFMHLYISNIGLMVTDESLRAIFATHGRVDFIKLSKDQIGTARNNALVHMPVESEAIKAMNILNGSIINGCSISIQSS